MNIEKNKEWKDHETGLSKTRNLGTNYKLLVFFLLSFVPTAGNLSEVKWENKEIYSSTINSSERNNALILYAVKNALSKVEDINDFPIDIHYDKLTKEIAEKAGLPTSLNINPKEIKDPANHIEIDIWNIKYQIEPRKWVGKVNKLEFKDHVFYTKIGCIMYTWTIDEIGDYCLTLLDAKWKDISFLWAHASNISTAVSKIK